MKSIFEQDITSEKITVLGIEFNSEEERREYFRNELRKKLPELKKMEGFPIGEDDDIINLSDPPFYTACPNPWLNDFIDEWNKINRRNEKEGKRNPYFLIDKPYASDVKEGKNNPIYTAHTYHTKVPHPAIMRYILYYTQPGDNILDAFGGTGMTGVASQICENPDVVTRQRFNLEWRNKFKSDPVWGRRNAICNDLSTFASYISYSYNSPSNVDFLSQESDKIYKKLIEEISWMYETLHDENKIGTINYVVWSDVYVCCNCGHEILFWESAFNFEQKKVLN